MKNRMKIFLLSLALVGLIVSTSCSASKTPTVTTNSLSEGTEGQAYSQTLQVHGGTPPYTWFAMATLPPGLQLDPLTGVISGTPLAGWGPTFVSFQVTDHTGMGSEKQLLITVNPTTTTASTTTTTPNNNNSASSKSTSGLSLSLSLDSTTYQPSQQITIVIDEMNTLSSSNNVHASNDWALNGLILNNCGIESYPFGISIFRGYCISSTISKATSLYFYDHTIDHGCQSIANFSDYIFTPKSDLASSVFNETTHSYAPLKYEITTNGYWPVYVAPNYNYFFSTFEPGIYTVVAGDEWGNLVILHFTVAN